MLDGSERDKFSKAHALAVDDDIGVLRMICRLLRELGFAKVEQADNGATALEKLRVGRFDVVIADWNMEPVSGLHLLREMRADRRLSPIKFVMVTGKSDPNEVALAKAAGVNGYLLKPFNLLNLRKQLAHAL